MKTSMMSGTPNPHAMASMSPRTAEASCLSMHQMLMTCKGNNCTGSTESNIPGNITSQLSVSSRQCKNAIHMSSLVKQQNPHIDRLSEPAILATLDPSVYIPYHLRMQLVSHDDYLY